VAVVALDSPTWVDTPKINVTASISKNREKGIFADGSRKLGQTCSSSQLVQRRLSMGDEVHKKRGAFPSTYTLS